MMLSRTKMLIKVKESDLQRELFIHPPKQVILQTLVWFWLRKPLHKTVKGSVKQS